MGALFAKMNNIDTTQSPYRKNIGGAKRIVFYFASPSLCCVLFASHSIAWNGIFILCILWQIQLKNDIFSWVLSNLHSNYHLSFRKQVFICTQLCCAQSSSSLGVNVICVWLLVWGLVQSTLPYFTVCTWLGLPTLLTAL